MSKESMDQIEYFFDFTCPYAFAGFQRIRRLAQKQRYEIVWKPILLGGVLKHVGTSQDLLKNVSESKRSYVKKDIVRSAKMQGLEVSIPNAHPIKSVRALRTLLSLPTFAWEDFIERVFEAYWINGEDISSTSWIDTAVQSLGLSKNESNDARNANKESHVKEELRARTQEAVDRKVFGVPTFFIGPKESSKKRKVWGQDRIQFFEEKSPIEKAESGTQSVEFFFDFSSPYAYLASTQIGDIESSTGATCIWTPMLLGAIFKSLGTANVPLLTMAPEKQEYLRQDLNDWAEYFCVPFSFPEHFPLRSVLPLRLVMVAKEKKTELICRLMHLYWVDNRDISNVDVLKGVLNDLGLNSNLLEAADSQVARDGLRKNTSHALEKGVFGTPTFYVESAGSEELFWGQDRIDQLKMSLNKRASNDIGKS